MSITEMQNLAVTLTQKKGHFKFTGKIKSVVGKSNCFYQSPALPPSHHNWIFGPYKLQFLLNQL